MRFLYGMVPKIRLSTLVIIVPFVVMIFALNLRPIEFYSSNEGYVFQGSTLGFPFVFDAVYSFHLVEHDIRDLEFDVSRMVVNLIVATVPAIFVVGRWADTYAVGRTRKLSVLSFIPVGLTLAILVDGNIRPGAVVHSYQRDYDEPIDRHGRVIRCYRGGAIFEQGWPFRTYRFAFARLVKDEYQIYVDDELMASGPRAEAFSAANAPLFDSNFNLGQRRTELHRRGHEILVHRIFHSRSGYSIFAAMIVGWYFVKVIQLCVLFLNHCIFSLKLFLKD